jgi:hypothetical protein
MAGVDSIDRLICALGADVWRRRLCAPWVGWQLWAQSASRGQP